MAESLKLTIQPITSQIAEPSAEELVQLRATCSLGSDTSRDEQLIDFYRTAVHQVNAVINRDVRGARVVESWDRFYTWFSLRERETPVDPVLISWHDESHALQQRTLSGTATTDAPASTDWIYDSSTNAYRFVGTTTPVLSNRYGLPVSITYGKAGLMDDLRVVQSLRNYTRLNFAKFFSLETPTGALLASTRELLCHLVEPAI